MTMTVVMATCMYYIPVGKNAKRKSEFLLDRHSKYGAICTRNTLLRIAFSSSGWDVYYHVEYLLS